MLVFLRSFHLIALFLLIRTSSIVSIPIETKCSTDNDCNHQLICDTNTNICVCSKPYFWREDIQTCLGCAPGWLDFETNKCLLYANSRSPGMTWYQAETICKDLFAQPMLINSTNEFKDLQRNIEYLLNGDTALAATLYFHQGAWIEINNEWIDSYTWCNNVQSRDGFDCVQIRQNALTNTICLQYVSCFESAQFICEAKPVARLVLEKNIAESKRTNMNQEIINRSRRQANPQSPPVKTSVINPTPKVVNQLVITTKKPSSWNAEHITSLATTGMQTVGQLANAFGSIFGKSTSQPTAASDQSAHYNNQGQMPQALASDTGENSNSLFFYAAIVGGLFFFIIIIIIISFVVCSKKKTRSTHKSSIRSTESETSVVSNDE